MTWIFAYGSNMDLAHLYYWFDHKEVQGVFRYRGCRAIESRRARLPGYKLVFNYRRGGGLSDHKRGTGASNVLDVRASEPSSSVWGVALRVDALTEQAINRKEGYLPTHVQDSSYLRTIEDVIFDDNTSVPAVIYYARITEPRFITPLREYKQFILNGARQFNLPQDYVEWLQSIETREEQIEKEAFFRWERRHHQHGHDWSDWLLSEEALRRTP